MFVLLLIIGVVIILLLLHLFTRYDPKIDLAPIEDEKITVYLWYNKYNKHGEYLREYVKLFEIKV